ncbi:hypothetical protein [Methanosarcina barkeri]|uniref:hypothetical protein n=1 Tax=Methanosarcina barkeri TaxID=2208 RepID=UPI001FB5504C|nr:hypothetical protein [Methanosarcina barkeri]
MGNSYELTAPTDCKTVHPTPVGNSRMPAMTLRLPPVHPTPVGNSPSDKKRRLL